MCAEKIGVSRGRPFKGNDVYDVGDCISPVTRGGKYEQVIPLSMLAVNLRFDCKLLADMKNSFVHDIPFSPLYHEYVSVTKKSVIEQSQHRILIVPVNHIQAAVLLGQPFPRWYF